MYFVLGASGQHGYYSSDQPGGLGGKDVYRVTFLGPEPAPVVAAAPAPSKRPTSPKGKPTAMKAVATKPALAPPKPTAAPLPAPVTPAVSLAHVTIMKGVITDAMSKKPLPATIEVIDNEKGAVVATFQANATTGRYLVSLPSGHHYGVAVRQTGYLPYSENVNLPAGAPYAELPQDVALSRPTLGTTVELRNIFFVPAQAELRPESAAELRRLQQLLTEQPALRLELSAQGDADATANADLRQQRAEAVVAYLASHGIARTRLSTAALGQPMASVAATPQLASGPTAFRVIATGN